MNMVQHALEIIASLVNIREGNSYKTRQTSKEQQQQQKCQEFCSGKVHNRAQSFDYVTKTFLLVSSSVISRQQLRYPHYQQQKKTTIRLVFVKAKETEQKPHAAKNFVVYHNHSLPFTMVCISRCFSCVLQGKSFVLF